MEHGRWMGDGERAKTPWRHALPNPPGPRHGVRTQIPPEAGGEALAIYLSSRNTALHAKVFDVLLLTWKWRIPGTGKNV